MKMMKSSTKSIHMSLRMMYRPTLLSCSVGREEPYGSSLLNSSTTLSSRHVHRLHAVVDRDLTERDDSRVGVVHVSGDRGAGDDQVVTPAPRYPRHRRFHQVLVHVRVARALRGR